MVEPRVKSEKKGDLFLPPGFRFHPTDEEIITSYLLLKFLNPSFSPRAMGEVDLNKCEPWDLPSKAKMGEKEWYFFCHKDMKYPTGMRTNRATKEGYWKATGKDKEIYKPASDGDGGRELVGMKKTLVFYMGRAPRGSKTNWVMHEYRLQGKSRHNNANLRFNPKDEWVVCKVHHKKGNNGKTKGAEEYDDSAATPNVSSVEAGDGDEFLDNLIDPSFYFNSSAAGSLADTTTTTNTNAAAAAAAAPYNADYSMRSNAVGTASSFVDQPTYGFNGTTRGNQNQLAGANSTVPRSSSYDSSPWNMLLRHADQHEMGSYNLHHQAMMVKALGGAIAPNFAAGLPSSSAAVTGNFPQHKLENYPESYATHVNGSGVAAIASATAKNLGDRRLVR